MSKMGNFWMEEYERIQELSDFSEFRREMERLGFDTDAMLEHWDANEEWRKEKAPCVSEKT